LKYLTTRQFLVPMGLLALLLFDWRLIESGKVCWRPGGPILDQTKSLQLTLMWADSICWLLLLLNLIKERGKSRIGLICFGRAPMLAIQMWAMIPGCDPEGIQFFDALIGWLLEPLTLLICLIVTGRRDSEKKAGTLFLLFAKCASWLTCFVLFHRFGGVAFPLASRMAKDVRHPQSTPRLSNVCVEPPQFDRLVEEAVSEIARLRKPGPHKYELIRLE
jgi:hypothetical protein